MAIIKSKELSKIGYTDDRARSLAINIVSKHYKHAHLTSIQSQLSDVIQNPDNYLHNEIFKPLAEIFTQQPKIKNFKTYELNAIAKPYKMVGKKEIEDGARRQMNTVMRLPISVSGAMMPDAHSGFGMPIGGVLATQGVVIPYAIGVDIGCQMSLSIFDAGENFLESNKFRIKEAIQNNTHFGLDGGLALRQEHEILDNTAFSSTELLRKLRGKAKRQLGTSGTGNHFVDAGLIEIDVDVEGLKQGKYYALLSHSGSRGLGSGIAQHYIKIAMDQCRLPNEAKYLAWLDMESEAGQEYWLSMNLAGDYARACHEQIHRNFARELGLKVLTNIGNIHNLAWKETMCSNEELIVHRKGASPAHKGSLGIIPGSMCSQAYLVRGRGNTDALNSASHGAGRIMSRQKAKDSMTNSALRKILDKKGIDLIGGSITEGPDAYKDIETVISAQSELINVLGKFYPKIVRMYKE